MKLKTLPQKLRATVVSSAHNLAVQTTAFKTSVVVSFFKLRIQVGFFLSLKFFQDNVSLQSLTTLFLTKPVTDSGIITDAFVSESTKDFTNNVLLQSLPALFLSKTAADSAAVQDVIDVVLNKIPSDTGTFSDVFINQYAKNVTNNLGLSDTGSIVVQSYCGPDYFAGDYVGIARTF